jgi:oligopeptidase B
MKPPIAKKIPKELSIHGDTRIDNYYWLREREDQEVIDYLNAENAYTKERLKHTEPLQEELFKEMKGRIKEEDQSVPYKDNGYFYITRYEEGHEYPIYSRKKETLEAEEQIMLNVNELAEEHAYFNINARSVSPNNQLLAYGEDTVSRRIYTIRFKNLETGEMLEDTIPNTSGKAVWANDNETVFYVQKDTETLRDHKVFRHKIGTPISEDVEVWHESDESYLTYIYKTKSKKYIVIGSYYSNNQDYRILPADDPTGDFTVFHAREQNLEYDFAHFDGHFYVRTNWNAQNFRLMRTPENATAKENWEEVLPHRSDVLLEDIEVFRDFMVLSERINGITQIRVHPWGGKNEHYIQFEEEAFVAGVSINPEFDTQLLRLTYQSMTTPPSVFDYHMVEKTFDLKKEQEILGGFDKHNYHSERLYAPAVDGEKIPISLVYREGFEKNGQGPLLLYAYGSYGHSMEPWFSPSRLSLLDRGFTFAIAHIRGGEEMGRRWYDDGKMLKKKNTFYDFIACAEYLILQRYTSKEKIFAMGGSAGGLLMGAIYNMRPDLWKGIVAAVPFVDVVTTMLDTSIPLTTFEYHEWGNPNEKKYYDYMKSYSPYDNVEAKDYPAMLVTTGLHDSQVQYWEPAKWVAKLREMKTNDEPLLLHTNMEAGHGGASGRFRRLKDLAMEYAFVIDLAK